MFKEYNNKMSKVVFATENRFGYEILIETTSGRKANITVDKFLADRLGPYEDPMENAKWIAMRDFQES